MLGSTQVDRSNAVGHNPSYISEVNPGMTGGNTYTAASSEPSIQDYENIFGPSARDIKTDLQRFKRHGRWHLPDVLKGPNPWLTDRIDGLITDATNSPFTTKILPYLYKEDPDGKFTWNVWQFDEGMASRVPYESAARHLTQSKRSFEGYMVRHGMAIVLEHNFMMSPKGRENFKNQLNQLIGSIQYSNDFDVHMALVLAPSYQKTMREKYFTVEKTAGQICRDYCDLFGMLQKNVNALDILIEEAKAILKTWGGPMPDFLLCNSKLTFQLTMTPEKTNYITQGADGVKRLKQGPDIANYRGLSIIHSRAFSLEVGQQPRDILRRRVRTAEYYRIPPHKDNYKREFELYTEERDGHFTLSFTDLLRMAMHRGSGIPSSSDFFSVDAYPQGGSSGQYGLNNHNRLQLAYTEVTQGRTGAPSLPVLGAPVDSAHQLGTLDVSFIADQRKFASKIASGNKYLMALFGDSGKDRHVSRQDGEYLWRVMPYTFDMGIHHTPPENDRFPLWTPWKDALVQGGIPDEILVTSSMSCIPRLNTRMEETLFEQLKGVHLYHPFRIGHLARAGTPDWYMSFTFYQEVYRRHGVNMSYFHRPPDTFEREISDNSTTAFAPDNARNVHLQSVNVLANIGMTVPAPNEADMYVGDHFLSQRGLKGCVNHELQFVPQEQFPNTVYRYIEESIGGLIGRTMILTYEFLEPIMRKYDYNGAVMTGLDYLQYHLDIKSCQWGEVRRPAGGGDGELVQVKLSKLFITMTTMFMGCPLSALEWSVSYTKLFIEVYEKVLNDLKQASSATTGGMNLAQSLISTWPMGVTTRSHLLHPACKFACTAPDAVTPSEMHEELLRRSSVTYGHLNVGCLQWLQNKCQTEPTLLATHHFMMPVLKDFNSSPRIAFPGAPTESTVVKEWNGFWECIRKRIYTDPVTSFFDNLNIPTELSENIEWRPFEMMTDEGTEDLMDYCMGTPNHLTELGYPTRAIPRESEESLTVDLNAFFKKRRTPPVRQASSKEAKEDMASQVEIVIVRPNIEHNMLGIIMGLAGSELGYTLWGQTELSCYDDSMHGIWGMSYKYHERAVVFNERNLVRLWDIAYDGYNGGKDDTFVNWMNPDDPKNGLNVFREATLDLGRSYRGPSMMVMAFVHDKHDLGPDGRLTFDTYFRRNWPSPIVFHDTHDPKRAAGPANETLPLDYENLQVLDVSDFRVFNNPLYAHSYGAYRAMMPAFHELHKMRKSAGQASADSETHTDCLAFQGSMRIKQDGRVLQEIQGSGHHGPDYVGVASVRAGKGIKYNGGAPALTHMV